ncbi:MAG: hypothetical protein RR585_04525 [Coprobacillus sp.]
MKILFCMTTIYLKNKLKTHPTRNVVKLIQDINYSKNIIQFHTVGYR